MNTKDDQGSSRVAGLDTEVTTRAIAALTSGQQTFTSGQVAYLLALAFQAGTTATSVEALDDPAATNLAYAAGHDRGFNEGYNAALAEVHEAQRFAFGGPKTKRNKTMKDAVAIHLRAVDQRNARQKADQGAAAEQPRNLRLDDPDWPPVTVPGTAAKTDVALATGPSGGAR